MSSDSCCESGSPYTIQQPFIKYNVQSSASNTNTSMSYCDNTDTSDCCYQEEYRKLKKKFNNPDVSTFRSLIVPLSALTPANAKFPGPIEFRMRRKNRVVSLQWEPFSGIITTTGITNLMMVQTIANMPPYIIYGVYNLEYNGILRQAPVVVDPTNVKSQVLFYLNADGTSTNVNANDTVNIKGGLVQWIVSC